MALTFGSTVLFTVFSGLVLLTTFWFPSRQNGRGPSAMNMQSLRTLLQNSSYFWRTLRQTEQSDWVSSLKRPDASSSRSYFPYLWTWFSISTSVFF